VITRHFSKPDLLESAHLFTIIDYETTRFPGSYAGSMQQAYWDHFLRFLLGQEDNPELYFEQVY
jgi:hypothetical protein